MSTTTRKRYLEHQESLLESPSKVRHINHPTDPFMFVAECPTVQSGPVKFYVEGVTVVFHGGDPTARSQAQLDNNVYHSASVFFTVRMATPDTDDINSMVLRATRVLFGDDRLAPRAIPQRGSFCLLMEAGGKNSHVNAYDMEVGEPWYVIGTSFSQELVTRVQQVWIAEANRLQRFPYTLRLVDPMPRKGRLPNNPLMYLRVRKDIRWEPSTDPEKYICSFKLWARIKTSEEYIKARMEDDPSFSEELITLNVNMPRDPLKLPPQLFIHDVEDNGVLEWRIDESSLLASGLMRDLRAYVQSHFEVMQRANTSELLPVVAYEAPVVLTNVLAQCQACLTMTRFEFDNTEQVIEERKRCPMHACRYAGATALKICDSRFQEFLQSPTEQKACSLVHITKVEVLAEHARGPLEDMHELDVAWTIYFPDNNKTTRQEIKTSVMVSELHDTAEYSADNPLGSFDVEGHRIFLYRDAFDTTLGLHLKAAHKQWKTQQVIMAL